MATIWYQRAHPASKLAEGPAEIAGDDTIGALEWCNNGLIKRLQVGRGMYLYDAVAGNLPNMALPNRQVYVRPASLKHCLRLGGPS